MHDRPLRSSRQSREHVRTCVKLALIAAVAPLAPATVRAQASVAPDSTAQPATIAREMSRAEVEQRLGRPTRVSAYGANTNLFYTNGCSRRCGTDDVVFLTNGVVVDAIFHSPSRRYAATGPRPASTGSVPATTRSAPAPTIFAPTPTIFAPAAADTGAERASVELAGSERASGTSASGTSAGATRAAAPRASVDSAARPRDAASAPTTAQPRAAAPVRAGPTAPSGAPVGARTAASSTPARARKKAVVVEYSDWYNRRLTIHRWASYATLPLFAGNYVTGQQLLAKGNLAPTWAIDAHGPLAASVTTLFAVNTLTGGWNLLAGRKDPHGRAWRTTHAVLMLAADAGFATAGILSKKAERSDQLRRMHRTVAIASIGVSFGSYVMMIPPFRRD